MAEVERKRNDLAVCPNCGQWQRTPSRLGPDVADCLNECKARGFASCPYCGKADHYGGCRAQERHDRRCL